MRSIYSIIKAPLLTEKSSRDTIYRKYVFSVDINSNKIEIKKAIEKIYNVKVDKIASLVVKGRTKRLRWNQPGRTTDWKKVVVTLREGYDIKFT